MTTMIEAKGLFDYEKFSYCRKCDALIPNDQLAMSSKGQLRCPRCNQKVRTKAPRDKDARRKRDLNATRY